MIEYFPQIDCVCFPFTSMSRKAQTDSVFDALRKQDVGAFGIKPFAAGSLFSDNKEENLKRVRLAIRYILSSDTVIPIPGLNSVEEVDNVVLSCHTASTLTGSQHKGIVEGTSEKVCTDCHGKHRLVARKCKWK